MDTVDFDQMQILHLKNPGPVTEMVRIPRDPDP
jgi:hypothetical protein